MSFKNKLIYASSSEIGRKFTIEYLGPCQYVSTDIEIISIKKTFKIPRLKETKFCIPLDILHKRLGKGKKKIPHTGDIESLDRCGS